MLSVAKILKSHGTDGSVLALLSSAWDEELETKGPVFVIFDGLPVPYFIESFTAKGPDKAVIRLTDSGNLEDAEELVGREIFIDAEDTDEVEDSDFTGWTVLDKGIRLGEVSDYEPIPGNLCLYVETPSGQVMIPLHEDFIIETDPGKRTMNLDLPAGLY